MLSLYEATRVSSAPYQNHPRITTVFDHSSDSLPSLLYAGSVRGALQKICSNQWLFDPIFDEEVQVKCLESFQAELPILKWSEWGGGAFHLSIFLLCPHRLHVSKFFYDMISRWLIPGRTLNVGLFFATDFKLPDLSEETYTLSEMALTLEQESDLEMMRQYLPIISAEIKQGISSLQHANRIREIKGMSADEKISLIQEKIASLVTRQPKEFDDDIFGLMQHFLVMCQDEFKQIREVRHLSRIIYILYAFRKNLLKESEKTAEKRHLHLKLVSAHLHVPFGIKHVLAIFVGMNILKENEIFEERHLLQAVKKQIPDIKLVENSYFLSEHRGDRIRMIYLEIEKIDASAFTWPEIRKMRHSLPSVLKNQVEHLMPPLFMPRNEEEVMRNIVTLSHQLKYRDDIPQVIISFAEQTETEICFTVVLLRVQLPDSPGVQELFLKATTHYNFVLERVKRVGAIRRKLPKEASVFRVRLPNIDFLRGNHSVDLYKARQEVVSALESIFGEVRDFNGGMISKQNELFIALKEALGEEGIRHEFLLENFFHSIFPVEMRSVLDPESLKGLFQLLLQLINTEGQQKSSAHVQKREDALFFVREVADFSMCEKILKEMALVAMRPSRLVTLCLQLLDVSYLGYICFSDNKHDLDTFLKLIKGISEFREQN